MAKLEGSKSTLHRTISALKDYLNAPVVFDAEAGGYKYAKEASGETYGLPGLWFTPRELQASATLQRRKLWIEYHARSTDERSERTISPQRVTHYRETWYLNAWDEEQNGLRTFAVDRITRANVLDAGAFDVPEAELDEHYASAYGNCDNRCARSGDEPRISTRKRSRFRVR